MVLRPAMPAVRFAGIMACFTVLALLGYRDVYLGPVLLPLRTLTAQAALALIQAIGLEAMREGAVIRHAAGFAYEISRGCMGVIPALFLAVGVTAWPGDRWRKSVALLLGIPLLIGLNLVRLVHLFYLGLRRPESFRFAHEVAWEGAIVLAVFCLWLGLTRWTGVSPKWEKPARGLRAGEAARSCEAEDLVAATTSGRAN
jgi:exosortase/archaeosortase family protein